MSVTPNFSWPLIQPTDFVTDLPADLEALADDIDADVWAIKGTADAALPETIIDAAGDLIYGTAADTAARLAIGTAGQVLTVNSGATAPQWVTPAGSSTSFSLLNSGGTALTGAQTVTISGISGMNQLYVYVDQASSANASSTIRIQLNGVNSTTSYFPVGVIWTTGQTYNAFNTESATFSSTGYALGKLTDSAAGVLTAGALITGCNSTGVKIVTATGGGNPIGSQTQASQMTSSVGYITIASAITSVSIHSSTGNLDAGTVFIYGSAV